MASDRKQKKSNSIPIRFFDGHDVSAAQGERQPEPQEPPEGPAQAQLAPEVASSAEAELAARRAELERLQGELAAALDTIARRQADFENYRKRVERQRGETRDRLVAELTRKLLPVVDNLGRALEAERSVEASESKEFRHFLHGVELVSRQLNDVLESMGVQPIRAVGERFDPHVHEAVVTEPSDEYEPDTVIEEMVRGYRIGDRLVRPAMVKVAAKPRDE